uniref:Keratin 18a, tandem duplicate 2 n=1 Tax=Neolamprologus brichardi TaxID=32507 RepID=A0A3Q4I2Q2_NEOBR
MELRRQSSQNYGLSSLGGPRSLRMETSYAHSVTGGAGGRGTKISSTSYGSRVGSGFGGGYDYQSLSSGSTSGVMGIGSEKHAMQRLNDRLANYLETVRNLEKANAVLEVKIREATENRGPLEGRDYSKYYTIIEGLRAQILDMTRANAQYAISLDNASLASDDLRTKYEYELSMRQTVEADVSRLRKILDDTNVTRLHLESEIESLQEELISLKKNHERVCNHYKVQQSSSKRKTYLITPIQYSITEVEVKVTESSTALKEAAGVMTETRRRHQALEIELQSAHSLVTSLEAALHDIERRYNLELEKYNEIILSLQEELAHIRSSIQQNTNEYEALLNIKVKLEAEIAEYRRLLDGEGDLKKDHSKVENIFLFCLRMTNLFIFLHFTSLEDAVDLKKIQVVTVTQTVVDGKVVSESKESKEIGSTENLAFS